MNHFLALSHNETALLTQLLTLIKESETPQKDGDQEIAAEVSLRYKVVEQRLVANVLTKLKELKQPQVIRTTIG